MQRFQRGRFTPLGGRGDSDISAGRCHHTTTRSLFRIPKSSSNVTPTSFLKLTVQCDVYELLQLTVHYARVFGIQSASCNQLTTSGQPTRSSKEQRGARSTAGSCIFRRPVHLYATTPGARRIVSIWPRSFVLYTYGFPAEALVRSGSSIVITHPPSDSARRVSCRPHSGARTCCSFVRRLDRMFSQYSFVRKCSPIFGFLSGRASEFPRKRWSILACIQQC